MIASNVQINITTRDEATRKLAEVAARIRVLHWWLNADFLAELTRSAV